MFYYNCGCGEEDAKSEGHEVRHQVRKSEFPFWVLLLTTEALSPVVR